MSKNKRYSIDMVVCFKYPTSDNWHPSFPNNTVEVKLYAYHQPDSFFKMVVRGADDTLMSKDVSVPPANAMAKQEELRKWLENALPNPLTMEWLKSQGFRFD